MTKIEERPYECKHLLEKSELLPEKYVWQDGRHFRDGGRHFQKGSTPNDTGYQGSHFSNY